MNISCDVMSNPPATMLWRRERFTISAEGTANTRVHSGEGKSVLEVSPSPEPWPGPGDGPGEHSLSVVLLIKNSVEQEKIGYLRLSFFFWTILSPFPLN